jgi:hypothetical protein
VLAAVYAAPLSGGALDRQNLEGRFLEWISKQKGAR